MYQRHIFFSRCLTLPWMLVFLLVSGLLQASEENRVLTVETAVGVAVRDNPNLAEMQVRYKALAEVPSQVKYLFDKIWCNENEKKRPARNAPQRSPDFCTKSIISFTKPIK